MVKRDRSNDRPLAVRIEMRAAELNATARASNSDNMAGYAAHFLDRDPPRRAKLDWWAGWLDREMSLDRKLEVAAGPDPTPGLGSPDAFYAAVEKEHADVGALIAKLPELTPSDPHWQDRVLDQIDREASLDSVDQSEPMQPPEVPLVDIPDRHSDDEATHVGAVDARFDDSDKEES